MVCRQYAHRGMRSRFVMQTCMPKEGTVRLLCYGEVGNISIRAFTTLHPCCYV